MNKNNLQSMSSKNLLFGGVVVAILFFSFFGIQSAYAAITSELDFGSRGADVTELQTYLSLSASIYPSGLVTGYFGSLTQAGVQRFQTAQGIVTSGTPETTGYGRVGPRTMAMINSLMGGSTQAYWDTVPVLTNPSIDASDTRATFTWTTNEPTQGQLYYDDEKLQVSEATGPRQQPYVSGTLVVDSGGLSTSHSVTIQNLTRDTIYYFTTRGVDVVGNMSMTWPSSFRTDN